MLQKNSIDELKKLLYHLQSKLEEMNQKWKSDKPLFSESNMQILKSNAPELEKKKWIISKILDVRLNLFAEYSQQRSSLEELKDFDNAIELMNEYIENLAIPFIDSLDQPPPNRFVALFKRKNIPTPEEYLQKWKADYESWFKSAPVALSTYEINHKYNEMKTTFHMLYNYSFSSDNVPERQVFVIVDLNKVKFP